MIKEATRRRARKKVAKKRAPAKKAKKKAGIDVSASYNRYKEYNGKQYTGMAIGRNHKWYYDKGEWRDTKITPDLWEISYAVTKRRAGHAPEGSGAAVGTGYHWFIIAHQNVKKLNADDYSTILSGLKYKVAHKRASSDKWSATVPTQRKHIIKFLKDMITQLEKEPVPLELEYKGTKYKGEAMPIAETCHDGVCSSLDIMLNGEHMGIIHRAKTGWKMHEIKDQGLIDAIGDSILLWYE
jgi:hypothetical protein